MESPSSSTKTFVAIVNPAAGGGRCGRRAPAAIAQLRRVGVEVETRETTANGDAIRIARQAYDEGYRNFIAAGGDGTCFEVLNGLAPHGLEFGLENGIEAGGQRASLAVLPLGTGNSFLREFTTDGADRAIQALIEGQRRRCDVLRLTHRDGHAYFVNLFGFGFAADVTINTLRGRYKRYGALGYVLGVLHTVIRLRHPILPTRAAGGELDSRPLTFLCVCNSRYTAGAMLMAPAASVNDGLADLVRVEALGRFDIVRTFPKIYRGTHLEHPAVSAHSSPKIEFETTEEVEVMVDGEILKIVPQSIEVLPGALEVCI